MQRWTCAPIVTLFLIFLFINNAFGEDLSLAHFLKRVADSHPSFKSKEQSLLGAKEDEVIAKGPTQWILSGDARQQYQKPVGPSAFLPENSYDTNMSVQVGKTISSTGGTFSSSYNYTYTNQLFPTFSLPGIPAGAFNLGSERFHTHGFFVSYVQPLLQNFGGDLLEAPVELAKLAANYKKTEIDESKEAILLAAAMSYIQYASIQEQLKLLDERLALADRQELDMRRKFGANVAERVEWLRAKSQKQAVEQAQAVLAKQLEMTQKTLGYFLGEPWSFDALLPNTNIDHISERNQLRIVDLLKTSKNILDQRIRQAETRISPNLNLGVSAGVQGGREAYADSLELNQPNLLAFLTFQMPLDRSSLVSEKKKYLFEGKALQLQLEDTQSRLQSTISEMRTKLSSYDAQLTILEERISTAEQQEKEEGRLYRQGRNDFTFWLASQDQTRLLQLERVGLLAQRELSRLELLELTDNLYPLDHLK